MSNFTSRSVQALLVLVLTSVGLLGPAAAGHAEPIGALAGQPALAGQAQTGQALLAPCGDTSGFAEVALSSLPAQAEDTVELIQRGGPFPYPQDGGVFQNRERLLPDCSIGYYHEYTVKTPGSPDRGARRIVTGSSAEYFYTADHYQSFVLVDIAA